jgi:guanylate kinase
VTSRVVVLSAPSGGGKTTIAKTLLARRTDMGYSVSATTRNPRPEERDGAAYHFLSRPEFERRVQAGDFLEWAEYAGELYGTVRSEVERHLAAGRHVVLDIDVQGARQVRQAYPPPRSVSVFIVPPSLDELVRRLRSRGTESNDVLATRLEIAEREIADAIRFDHVIVNDDLEQAVALVGRIIDGREDKRRQPGALAGFLEQLAAGLVNEATRLRAQARSG